MRNEMNVPVRVYQVISGSEKTGDIRSDIVVLEKAKLQAAGQLGMSDKELIHFMFKRAGRDVMYYHILEKRTLTIDLNAAYQAVYRQGNV